MQNEIIYIAHRGYSSKYPENTRIAFQKAVENGFRGLEFDVHITKDKKAVITHDEIMTRMTLGKENRRISEMTLEELRQCDMSGEFNVPKQTIMTLEEFCEEFSEKFELIIMELKTDKYTYEDIEKISWQIIKPYVKKKKARWIMSSFNIETCLNFIKLNTKIDVALLYVFLFMIKNIDLKLFTSLHPEANLLLRSRDKVKVKKNAKFNVWTVNDKKTYDQLIELQKNDPCINGIITNFKIWDSEFGEEQVLNKRDQALYKTGLAMEKKYLKTINK